MKVCIAEVYDLTTLRPLTLERSLKMSTSGVRPYDLRPLILRRSIKMCMETISANTSSRGCPKSMVVGRKVVE